MAAVSTPIDVERVSAENGTQISTDVNNALVYYDNDLILKIDLNTKLKEYKVKDIMVMSI